MNILYWIVKIWVRFTLHLFCKRITWHDQRILSHNKPLLIGAHHPNSFMDAILIGAYMKLPVHFMTRSDVFKWSWVRFILRKLHMIPVYRIRDGKEKLGLNDTSFKEGCNYLKKGDHVLIFVEGFCENQTTLQPLKKGAPRMLLQSWNDGVEVEMLPLWIRYHSFSDFGKSIDIMPGQTFGKQDVPGELSQGAAMQWINQQAERQLQQLSAMQSPPDRFRRNLLLLPLAILGFLLHFPFYYLFKSLVTYINRGSVHYDSLMYSLMAMFYPFWLMVLWLMASSILPFYAALTIPLLAVICARAFVLWK